jgi:hypothetical protein
MPQRVDAIMTALLTGRSMCFSCIGSRIGITEEGARAAVDHLAETIAVHRRHERCHACGEITDTVSVDHLVRQ